MIAAKKGPTDERPDDSMEPENFGQVSREK